MLKHDVAALNIRELYRKAVEDTPKLKASYRRLTSTVGLIGSLVWLAIVIWLLPTGMQMFDLPLDGGPIEGHWLQTFKFGFSFVVVSLLIGYVVVSISAGTVAFALFLMERVSGKEALRYAFLFQYPKNWFSSR